MKIKSTVSGVTVQMTATVLTNVQNVLTITTKSIAKPVAVLTANVTATVKNVIVADPAVIHVTVTLTANVMPDVKNVNSALECSRVLQILSNNSKNAYKEIKYSSLLII